MKNIYVSLETVHDFVNLLTAMATLHASMGIKGHEKNPLIDIKPDLNCSSISRLEIREAETIYAVTSEYGIPRHPVRHYIENFVASKLDACVYCIGDEVVARGVEEIKNMLQRKFPNELLFTFGLHHWYVNVLFSREGMNTNPKAAKGVETSCLN